MNRTLMPHQPLIKNQPIASPACSIPSRYQTFVIDNSDKKGFNSGTRRFQETELTDTPGPGHYNSKNHEIEKILLARHKFAKQYSKNYKKHIAKNIKTKNHHLQPRSSTSSVGQTSAQIQRNMVKKLNGNSSNRSKSAAAAISKSGSGPYTRVSKYKKISTEHDATFRGSYYRPRKPKKHHPDRFHPILNLRRAIY